MVHLHLKDERTGHMRTDSDQRGQMVQRAIKEAKSTLIIGRLRFQLSTLTMLFNLLPTVLKPYTPFTHVAKTPPIMVGRL